MLFFFFLHQEQTIEINQNNQNRYLTNLRKLLKTKIHESGSIFPCWQFTSLLNVQCNWKANMINKIQNIACMVRMLFFCNWGTWTHQKQQIHTADLVCYLCRCLIVNFFKHFPKMDSEMNCSISGLSPVKYCKQRVNRSSAVRVPCGSSLSWKNLFWPIKQFVPHIFYWNNESTSRRPLCSPQAQ